MNRRRLLRDVSIAPFVVLISLYRRLISPLLPPRCRYYPSCSSYALTALRERGLVVGSLLAAWRIVRCNPWSLGGVDPVPPRTGEQAARNDDVPAPDDILGSLDAPIAHARVVLAAKRLESP